MFVSTAIIHVTSLDLRPARWQRIAHHSLHDLPKETSPFLKRFHFRRGGLRSLSVLDALDRENHPRTFRQIARAVRQKRLMFENSCHDIRHLNTCPQYCRLRKQYCNSAGDA